MAYPVVSVTTKDGLRLDGMLFEPTQKSEVIRIHLHGTAGNFYWNKFHENFVHSCETMEIAYLSTNNRGNGVYEIEKGTVSYGASLEKFEDCVLDINAWIEFALSKGYKRIILEGHSFGTEKSVYYMNKGSYVNAIIAVILLGFSDNVGTQMRYEKEKRVNYLAEAESLMKQGKNEYLLSDLYGLAGEMPISARTYISFHGPESANAQALPLRKGKDLDFFRNIHVPILGVIGDEEDGEYTIIHIKDAIELLKAENGRAEIIQLRECDHGFNGKEEELTAITEDFIKRRVLI